MKKAKRPRSIFFRTVIACLAILLAGFCVLEAIIITGGRSSKNQSGDALIVLLNSDESVRKLKGPSRPVNTEYDRAYLLASLEFVDAVLIFNDTRCYREIAALQPDCYAKGGDYTVDTLDRDERAALQSAGTEISFIQFVPGLSTSNTIRKMKLV